MMKLGVIPQYTLAYSKLFVWNMTQYQALLWMDSDTIAARSIHKLFLRADRCEKETKLSTFCSMITPGCWISRTRDPVRGLG